jgi:hypothetical protein
MHIVDLNPRTLANMQQALEQACSAIQNGDRHTVRAQIAEKILREVVQGHNSRDELTAAGQQTVAEIGTRAE